MSATLTSSAPPVVATDSRGDVVHVIRGELVRGRDRTYGLSGNRQFTTPALDLDRLVWPRNEPGPAFDVPLAEIIDLLVATGEVLRTDPDGFVAEAYEQMRLTGDLESGVLRRAYDDLPRAFDRQQLEFLVAGELGSAAVLDGWQTVSPPGRPPVRVRAFPPRLVHVLAGNVPGVAAISVIRGALSKGVNLLKLPSNDLFSATAILRAMAVAAPGHPVLRSFSAVYWRGGDASVESMLFRPQYFDKLVAWGGEVALRSAKAYIGPGFELVAFDPKTSISFIGREAFASDATLDEVAALAATDACAYNQTACTASRIQFVEGTAEQIDRYCAELQRQLGVERRTASQFAPPVPAPLREEIEGLKDLEPYYRVWGDYKGEGMVVRSEEPVEFYPDGKIVNVVPVGNLDEALAYANVATQTVGVFPPERKAALRDRLASAGVQRVVSLGGAMGAGPGIPHDGFYPLHRFMRWVTDEG